MLQPKHQRQQQQASSASKAPGHRPGYDGACLQSRQPRADIHRSAEPCPRVRISPPPPGGGSEPGAFVLVRTSRRLLRTPRRDRWSGAGPAPIEWKRLERMIEGPRCGRVSFLIALGGPRTLNVTLKRKPNRSIDYNATRRPFGRCKVEWLVRYHLCGSDSALSPENTTLEGFLWSFYSTDLQVRESPIRLSNFFPAIRIIIPIPLVLLAAPDSYYVFRQVPLQCWTLTKTPCNYVWESQKHDLNEFEFLNITFVDKVSITGRY
ncbi:hypothetical protein GGR56DRAFT_287428 [Xylariaceae sp. FL0804]|nr:hypothetical protein GGR56DRAFT_287428 [Xylariaceae sp. FL0804]